MRIPPTLAPRQYFVILALVFLYLPAFSVPLLATPTPVKIDSAICVDVLINEIKFKQDGSGTTPPYAEDEWVELYVATDLPAGTILTLDDMESSSGRFYTQFTLSTAVPAQNYIVVHANTEAESEAPTAGWLNIFGAGTPLTTPVLGNTSENMVLSVNGATCEEVHWGGRGDGNNGPPSPAAATEYAYGSTSNVAAGESIQRNPNGTGPSFIQGDDAAFHARTTIGANNNDGSVPVTVAWFQSFTADETLYVNWQTATETANAGFHLYHETSEVVSRLNENLIFSAVVDSLEPQWYRLELPVGDLATDAPLYLEDVSIGGQTRRHGPFVLGREYGARIAVESIDWAAINIESESKKNVRLSSIAGATNQEIEQLTAADAVVEPTELSVDSPPAIADPPYKLFLPLSPNGARHTQANDVRIDLQVDSAGIQRVDHADLLAAGIDFSGLNVDEFALINLGEPVPILVDGPARFGPDSFIEFWGQPLDSLYTHTNVYTLLVDRTLARRVESDTRLADAGVSPEPFYLETVTVDANRNYSVMSPNGDPWYSQRLSVRHEPETWDFPIHIDHQAEHAGPISLTVDLWGLSAWPLLAPDHHVEVLLNGELLADRAFDGINAQQITATLSSDLLQNDEINLALRLPADTGSDFEFVALDRYALTYPRAFVAKGAGLNFSASGDLFTVTGLPSSNIRVYRREGERIIHIATPIALPAQGGFSISFVGAGAAADYRIIAEEAISKPTVVPRRPIQGLVTGSADYVIVSHPDFIDGLGPLVQARERQGYEVGIINVEDVYALYGHGIVDPAAIQAYIGDAISHMGTDYFLLVGGDSYDYLNYLDSGSRSFIPSLYVQTHNLVRYSPADPLLTDIDSDGIPDAAIGRLPVRNSAELASIVQKTLAYERKTYDATGIFVADAEDDASYSEFSDALLLRLPAGWQITRAYLDEMSVESAKRTLIDTINSGVALTTFFGHSGPTDWTFERLFSADDATQLHNAQKPTVVSQWGCWNTYYATPKYNTLGHKFLLSGDRGAAAVLGASTLTQAASDLALGELLTPKLAQPGMTIGQAVLEAKQELAHSQGPMTDVLAGWTILGDPALQVQP